MFEELRSYGWTPGGVILSTIIGTLLGIAVEQAALAVPALYLVIFFFLPTVVTVAGYWMMTEARYKELWWGRILFFLLCGFMFVWTASTWYGGFEVAGMMACGLVIGAGMKVLLFSHENEEG